MPHKKICPTGSHALQKCMSPRKVCSIDIFPTQKYTQQEGILPQENVPYRRQPLARCSHFAERQEPGNLSKVIFYTNYSRIRARYKVSRICGFCCFSVTSLCQNGWYLVFRRKLALRRCTWAISSHSLQTRTNERIHLSLISHSTGSHFPIFLLHETQDQWLTIFPFSVSSSVKWDDDIKHLLLTLEKSRYYVDYSVSRSYYY